MAFKKKLQEYTNLMKTEEFLEAPVNEQRYLWLSLKRDKYLEKNKHILINEEYSDTDGMWSD